MEWDDVKAELGEHLKRSRESKGISIRDAAQRASLSKRTIQRIEGGETSPQIHTLLLYGRACGLTPDELLRPLLVGAPMTEDDILLDATRKALQVKSMRPTLKSIILSFSSALELQ